MRTISPISILCSLPLLLLPLPAMAQGAPPAPPKAPPPTTPEPAEAEAEVLEEEAVKPDQKNGVVSGKVVDGRSAEGLADVQVVVVNTKWRATTDFDGNFSLKLPPGTYSLRVFYPGYKARRLDNVRLTAGNVSRADVSLSSDKKSAEVEEFVVEVDPDRSTAATQLLLRRKAASTSDAKYAWL